MDIMTETDSIFQHITMQISYAEFFCEYLQKNKPCIIDTFITKKWKSCQDWIKDGNIDFDFMVKMFGDAVGPAANCNVQEYNANPKKDMSLKEYVDYLIEYRNAGYPEEYECLYLKDWHFVRGFPEYRAYEVPVYFESDWLNEFWDARSDNKDDYRFVYIGPKGSWTPFHADVFRSFSWSANICGKKKWILFPPGDEVYLTNTHGELAYDISDITKLDSQNYPNLSKLTGPIEIIQEPGQAIFVPTGWHHQVHNLEDTISINHNWLNGCNISLSWQYIKSCLANVQKEINDCWDMDGWNKQCQVILRATSGIDYIEFYKFLETVARRRLHAINKLMKDHSHDDQNDLWSSEPGYKYNESDCVSGDACLPNLVDNLNGANHKDNDAKSKCEISDKMQNLMELNDKSSREVLPCEKCIKKFGPESMCHLLFDLTSINEVLSNMLQDSNFLELDLDILDPHPRAIHRSLEKCIRNNKTH